MVAVELVKDVAAVLGVILSLASVIALCTKGGRKIVYLIIRKHTQELHDVNVQQDESIEEIKESLKAVNQRLDELSASHDAICQVLKNQCREAIKNIYYRYKNEAVIPLYERKTADEAYNLYSNIFHGNSWAETLHNEIVQWKIDPRDVAK